MRLGELVELNLSAIDLEEGLLHLGSKGRKGRIVPIGSLALDALKAYIQRRAEVLIELDITLVDAGALFLNGRGRRFLVAAPATAHSASLFASRRRW